jgi:hypothetical protein
MMNIAVLTVGTRQVGLRQIVAAAILTAFNVPVKDSQLGFVVSSFCFHTYKLILLDDVGS